MRIAYLVVALIFGFQTFLFADQAAASEKQAILKVKLKFVESSTWSEAHFGAFSARFDYSWFRSESNSHSESENLKVGADGAAFATVRIPIHIGATIDETRAGADVFLKTVQFHAVSKIKSVEHRYEVGKLPNVQKLDCTSSICTGYAEVLILREVPKQKAIRAASIEDDGSSAKGALPTVQKPASGSGGIKQAMPAK